MNYKNYKWYIIEDERIDNHRNWTSVMGVLGGVIIRYSRKSQESMASCQSFVPNETVENVMKAVGI